MTNSAEGGGALVVGDAQGAVIESGAEGAAELAMVEKFDRLMQLWQAHRGGELTIHEAGGELANHAEGAIEAVTRMAGPRGGEIIDSLKATVVNTVKTVAENAAPAANTAAKGAAIAHIGSIIASRGWKGIPSAAAASVKSAVALMVTRWVTSYWEKTIGETVDNLKPKTA